MRRSAAGTSVHCDRWNEGGVGGDSQPSQHKRLSQNKSQMQARVTQVCF